MIIQTPEIKRYLDDYDILFTSGFLMPLTIDLAKGDSISFDEKAILVHLSSKPSLIQLDKTLPVEDITIFTAHIISIQHRVREVVELSPEAQLQAQKVWQELATSTTIN